MKILINMLLNLFSVCDENEKYNVTKWIKYKMKKKKKIIIGLIKEQSLMWPNNKQI